jgi:hypothetical protein
MQNFLIELTRLTLSTQRAICQNVLNGMDQVNNQSLMWVDRKLDKMPFIHERNYRWMEEWVRIGRESGDNFKKNVDDLFEGTDRLLNELSR